MPIQATPTPKTTAIVLSLTLPNKDAIPAPLDQGEVIEKKKEKKKVIRKKTRRMIGNSGGEGFDQDQASLDDRKVIQTLMRDNILPHIIDKMVQMEDVERFNESFTAYLEITIFPELIHMKDALSKFWLNFFLTHGGAMERRESFCGLRAALTLSKDKKRKVEEKIDAKREQAIEVFKSFKVMEDTKIASTQEAFLEGFKIYMKRATKNFSEVDLDLLTDEPHEEVGPSNADSTSPTTKSTLGASKPTAKALESIPKPEATKNTSTLPASDPTEV
ncbi:hypothetical protein COCNU_16G000040 [Cocos nucifera]|uniref:Uncharacterized protein n=1 Tax=Cocos nucifera TaxID=13894 RepID=A0A8K0ND36_COCNU|nr:hypothetical protein COCNU_16G000040 [Cocos nucifera]